MLSEDKEYIDSRNKNSSFDGELKKNSIKIFDAEKQREKMAALGQLAGGIAHDFNNQLMSIIGNATMIQKTDDINKINEYAERIIHISQSTANLTKKILLFSKRESSINEQINLKKILYTTCSMIESILTKSIDFKYKYSAHNSIILGNETQIENLIINLIINSRDAMETGGTIIIDVEDTVIYYELDLSHGEVIRPGKYIKIIVRDDGIGMSEKTLNKIFEPYFSTKNKTKGTGLGLSVVFGTIKSHSGYINVISKKNLGTTFEVYLPVMSVNDTINKNDIVLNDENKNLIILVDDDTNVLDVEAELFEDLGYEVAKFLSPIEALKYYESENEKISFVVLDIVMPEMNGILLYNELQRINKDVVPVFISGYSAQIEYEELIKKGFIFIEKPFTFDELSTNISKLY
ncbi:MAG: ATP-binding protein [Tissierellia bacterium]|nr:ATP-binding protein [Tissierellia bacterium]MDD4780444.1 ATP-binding protein [Tissierellia bacterium]